MAAGDDRKINLDLFARDRTASATKSAAKNLDDVADSADDAAKATDKLSEAAGVADDAVEKLGDAADENAGHIEKLNREIDMVEKELQSLARAYARADDAAERADLAKPVRQLEKALRGLNKNKKTLEKGLLPDPGEAVAAAAKIGTSVGTEIGDNASKSLGAAVKPMTAVLAGVAVAAAPVIGATIAAAIIGGAGVGGVAGGVMLAARDPRVKAAGSILGKVLLEDLESRARVFVEPVLEGIADIHSGFAGMGKDLDRIFGNSAQFVKPLTEGILGFVQQVAGGVADLTDAAGPVIDVISHGVADLGQAIGDVFEDLSDNGTDAAVALQGVFQILEGTIRATGAVVNALTESFGFLAKVGAFGKEAQQEWFRLEMNAKNAAAANKDAAESLKDVGAIGVGVAAAIGEVADAMGDLNEQNRTLYGSTTDVAQALADTKKALEDNGATLDINTQKGRDNRDALENLSTTLAGNLEAFKKVNGEGPRTDAVAEANRQSFIRLATKMTGSKQAAIELANKLLGIPSVSPKINVRGVADAKAAARTVSSTLRAIKDENVNINYQINGTNSSALRAAYNKNARAEGGPVRKGEAYVVGEKRAEVFVPDRDGQIIPSIQDFARGGGMRGATAGGTQTMRHVLDVNVSGAEGRMLAMVREWFRDGRLP